MNADDLATEDARTRIAEAIAEAERDTAGEIVVVIAPRCDDYAFVPLAWAAIIALAVPPLLYAFFWLSPVTIYGAAVATVLDRRGRAMRTAFGHLAAVWLAVGVACASAAPLLAL